MRTFYFLLLSLVFFGFREPGIVPVDLRCEYREEPLGIDNGSPRFSWKLHSENAARGQYQSAFQILVAARKELLDDPERLIWDSKKQKSTQSVNVYYDGATLQSGTVYYWKVRVWDATGKASPWSSPARFSMGLLKSGDWKAEWIYRNNQDKRDHNWYRKKFSLKEQPSSALVYVASFGYHELFVNGKKVGNAVLNPVYSHKKKRLPYITYDIAKHLIEGVNVIGIWHAAGWSRWGRVKQYYDAPFVFKAQAEFKIDNELTILATDESWKTKKSHSSYIGPWDILDFGGEIIDERLRENNWNAINYNDSDWENAVIFDNSTAAPPTTANINLGPKGAVVVPSTDDEPPSTKITATLSAQIVEPQVKYRKINPVDVKENKDGSYLIDMGENYTGFFQMDLFHGKAGDTVTFLTADHKEVRSSWEQKSQYVFDATGTGRFSNRFNVAGGRWVTVTGISYRPKLKEVAGYVVTNDREQISTFQSSSKLLNTIYNTNLNTYLANTIDGILVDCPHRERRGWGEVSVAAMYGDALPNFESGAYLTQYTQLLQDSQADNGKMRAVINGDDFNFLMWMANSPITVWESYRMLGDKHILSSHFTSMQKWMDWLNEHSNASTGGSLKIGKRGTLEFPGLGDWCTPRGNFWSSSNSPESAHFNNCTYAYMLACAKKIAVALDKNEAAKTYAKRLAIQQAATHKNLYDPATGKYGSGKQINQALALLSGVTPDSEKDKVYDNLVDQVLYKFPYYDTGSSGQALYTRYFTEEGERMDLIYELLKDKRHPSYGYFIEQGKTTWPERWSAVGKSQIHTCYTGIGGYFIKGFGGIRPDPDAPGMQHFIVKPAVVGDLTFVNTSHRSMYGTIVSNWKKTDNGAYFHIEVPVNTYAKVYIPANNKEAVLEGEVLAENAEGVTFIKTEKSDAVGSYVVYNIASGNYDFKVKALPKVTYPEPLIKLDNLAFIGRMNASSMTIKSEKLPVYEAFRANDGDAETFWKARGIKNEWLEIEWFKPQTFNSVVVQEDGNTILSYTIQYLVNGKWKDLVSNAGSGSNKMHEFDTVTSTKCRIVINDSKTKPAIKEFKVFNSK